MRSTDFSDVFKVASAGMRVQGERLRIIAENIANADSTGLSPGAEPYRRRTILFKEVLDHATGLSTVKIASVKGDETPFTREFNPGHPAANAEGYVLKPNVKPLVESIDMKEAQRSYEANLSVIDTVKSMFARALDILRG
ncbi:MAG: flagellar basal body rod protein FlgC [Alphaproteobacteria bacterium]|nr:flagellar basal body rod protein FlgC [Alphaproteobacteria bacterium]